MILWQFITLTVLIAALLVYAIVITFRLGRADARLNKIEDALAFLAMSRSSESGDLRAAEGMPAEVPDEKEARGGYLTMRDLRVRSERMSSRTTGPDICNPVADLEKRAVLQTTRDLAKSHAASLERRSLFAIYSQSRDSPAAVDESVKEPPAREVSSESATTSVEGADAPVMGGEALSLPATAALSEEPAATAPGMEGGSDAAASSSSEQPAPTDQGPSGEDSVVKKNQETLLFLSHQRRRRRERLGY
jgi:hypothetical protein